MRALATILMACSLSSCTINQNTEPTADIDGGIESDAGMTVARCDQLVSDWTAAVQTLDRNCVAASDCVVAGDWAQCGCETLLTEAAVPLAVNAGAYDASAAAQMEQLFWSECAHLPDMPRICDLGRARPECVDGRCRASERFCCMCPPDAG